MPTIQTITTRQYHVFSLQITNFISNSPSPSTYNSSVHPVVILIKFSSTSLFSLFISVNSFQIFSIILSNFISHFQYGKTAPSLCWKFKHFFYCCETKKNKTERDEKKTNNFDLQIKITILKKFHENLGFVAKIFKHPKVFDSLEKKRKKSRIKILSKKNLIFFRVYLRNKYSFSWWGTIILYRESENRCSFGWHDRWVIVLDENCLLMALLAILLLLASRVSTFQAVLL